MKNSPYRLVVTDRDHGFTEDKKRSDREPLPEAGRNFRFCRFDSNDALIQFN